MGFEEIIATLKYRWKSFIILFILFSVIAIIGLTLLSGYGYVDTEQLEPEMQYQSIVVFGSYIPDNYLVYRFRLTDIVRDLLTQYKDNDKSDAIYSHDLTGDDFSTSITITTPDASTATQKAEELADYIIENIGIPVVEVIYISPKPLPLLSELDSIQTPTTAKGIGIIESALISLFLGFMCSFIFVMLINDMGHVFQTEYRIYRQPEMVGMQFFPIMGEEPTATAMALYQSIQRDISSVFCGLCDNAPVHRAVNYIADTLVNGDMMLGVINLDSENNFASNSPYVQTVSLKWGYLSDYSTIQLDGALEKLKPFCAKIIIIAPPISKVPVAPLIAGQRSLVYFIKLGRDKSEHLRDAIQYLGHSPEKLNGLTIVR